VHRDKRTGAVTLTWRYDSEVRRQLLSPDRFARLSLEAFTQLNTHAGMALYEICARYVDNPSRRTARRPWLWWRPVLTGNPEHVTSESGKANGKTPEYKYFKRDVLMPAIAEVNEATNLIISEPIEYKAQDNKTVVDIQFEVRLKAASLNAAKPLDGLVVDDLPLIGRAIELGLKQSDAERLLAQFGQGPLDAALEELAQRLRLPLERVPAVGNPVAWLRAVLERKASKTQAPAPAQPEGAGATEATAKRKAVLFDEWLRRRKGGLRRDFIELPQGRQEAVLEGFREELKREGRTQVLRRLDLSGWQHRLVLDAFIRHFGSSVYGEGWDQPSTEDLLELSLTS
jgi:hypothetical protein